MEDTLECDVVIVGAGPAGLSTAIRLKQELPDLNVLVLEKGAEIGAHILSGAVLDPRALRELLPEESEDFLKTTTSVCHEAFWYLSPTKKISLPIPSSIQNSGSFIVRLGAFTQYLGEVAQGLGVDIYPGFSATHVLFDEEKRIIGIQTGDVGLNRDQTPSPQFQAGLKIFARYTVLAEGARGSITQTLINGLNLQGACPQTYGIGIKELWELPVDSTEHQPGSVLHTVGWPLDRQTYGGSFIYHLNPRLISLGLVVGLDYANPYINPFEELQRLKTHPDIRPLLKNAERIAYGARALNEGGWQAVPQLIYPGLLLVGCGAGFMNVAKIKGTHTAMKSGMLAAEALIAPLQKGRLHTVIDTYPQALRSSWVAEELYEVRNIRPAFRYGLWSGLLHAALDLFLLKGKIPWTFKWQNADHEHLKPAEQYTPIPYPKPDGILTFDKLSSVYLTHTAHRENEPSHLKIRHAGHPVSINWQKYKGPEVQYCPAGVYEFLNTPEQPVFRVNAQNCIHCKTCDIKDPTQNIQWLPPEGGDGPKYSD